MLRRLFTVDDADRALVAVRPLVERIVANKRRMTELMDRVGPIHGLSSGETRADLEHTLQLLEELARELKSLIGEVEQLGAVVKDIDEGQVDFPAVLSGQPIYLSWQLGEERVTFYHRIEDGVAGRLPLPD